MNYLHLLRLVEAERARVEGRVHDALERYEEAIRLAAEHRYTQIEAMAYERCSDLYRALGRIKLADTYLAEARYGYVRWGATAKVAELDRRFPGIFARAAAAGGLPVRESVSITGTSSSGALDLRSVMKAARAISGEIVLDKLLAMLMATVVENAGAERGFLLLSQGDRLGIEAEWALGEVKVRGSAPLGMEERLSAAIVHYVARTKESVILGDASTEGIFTADPYVVAHHTRSVLALPLINQDKLVAIVYLENNLTRGAFTGDRREVLELLLAQAALSIHNAGLYRSLEEHSRTLEQRVDERTRELSAKNNELGAALAQLRATQHQLVTQEKLASLGALTAGIAHELKNPLNFVTNFADLSAGMAGEVIEQLGAERARMDPGAHADMTDTLEALRENVTKIREHGLRADSIISGMLLHARGTTGAREAADLNALVAESVSLAADAMRLKDPGFDVAVEQHYDPAVGDVDVAPQDLNRALINVIDNARYAVRQKSLGAGPGYAPGLRVHTRSLGERIEVRIRDNGTGIAEDVAERIYHPFFTTKPAGQGTGLGLSISRDIIVGHGGEIAMTTSPGEFTEFVITLPRRASAVAPG
jgi:signal transduction histidine kinase